MAGKATAKKAQTKAHEARKAIGRERRLAKLQDKDAQIRQILLLREQIRYQETQGVRLYWPQLKALRFHHLADENGQPLRERCFMAGNQLGKSYATCAETAMHATGLYPSWWKGHRFDRPTIGIVACESFLLTRDGPQNILCGYPKRELGMGLLPGDTILGSAPSGIPDGYESVRVRHVSGGVSTILFRAYSQGRKAMQAATVDYAQIDEEPPEDVYFELLTRTNITRGPITLAFTPLQGVTGIVKRFWGDQKDPRTGCVEMTLDDCELYTEEQKQQLLLDYPEHERDARAYGSPLAGSGLIYPVAWEKIAEDAFPIPKHWSRICGLDFGWDHPTTAVWMAWDREQDVVHVYACHGESRQLPIYHAERIKRGGEWIPVAWPHDGLQTGKDSGIQLAEQYRACGVNMLPEQATHDPAMLAETKASLTAVEPGIFDILTRMQTGRLKIASHLTKIRAEMQVYHRKAGKIVKVNDDYLDAMRYGIMMLRYAVTEPQPLRQRLITPSHDGWRV